jgi:hypothetical protein
MSDEGKAMNGQFKAMSVDELEKDIKRMLRVQFKEFIHYLDEGMEPKDPATGARVRKLVVIIGNPVCERIAA